MPLAHRPQTRRRVVLSDISTSSGAISVSDASEEQSNDNLFDISEDSAKPNQMSEEEEEEIEDEA